MTGYLTWIIIIVIAIVPLIIIVIIIIFASLRLALPSFLLSSLIRFNCYYICEN